MKRFWSCLCIIALLGTLAVFPVSAEEIRFTLFDTRDSLQQKLEKAHSLGVTRAVGLYQELGQKW